MSAAREVSTSEEVREEEPIARMVPLLSICIPTYNRADRVVALARRFLSVAGPFEVCVHVDGSTDGTWEDLTALTDARLRLTVGPNRGRAAALVAACRAARGRFVMIFDDDDDIYPAGLELVLEDCGALTAGDALGYIYHMQGEDGQRIGDAFPRERTNFLALRADDRVRGDKKEVVQAEALKQALYEGDGRYRRVPTSLLWARLALRGDVLCRNTVIGRKVYLADGMTANASRNKRQNAFPLFLLYAVHAQGFIQGRYRSLRFLARATGAMIFHGARATVAAVLQAR